MKIFGGNANPELTEEVCEYLDIEQGNITVDRFPDGEIKVIIEEDIRGNDVFFVQPTCDPVNNNLMELLVAIDAFKRASAKRVTAVMPYYGYARQDRKHEGRVPISAKLVANLLVSAGVDRILTIDLHSSQIQGFFDIPVDHLFAAPVLIEYMKDRDLDNICVVAPDAGSIKMSNAFAKRLDADFAIVDKRRVGPTEVKVSRIVGNVTDKNVIIVDDMIATGGSILNACKIIKDQGPLSLYVMASHPVLCGDAIENLKKIDAKEIIMTNSIPVKDKQMDNMKILSLAGLLGEAMRRIHHDESVSKLFI